MGPLVLAKNFLMVAHQGQRFLGDWTPMDSEFQNAEIHVHCQTISPTGLGSGFTTSVESSFDRVENYQLGGALAVNAPFSQTAPVTSDIGPWVRLRIENVEAVPVVGILSVWLQAKST